VDFRYEEHHEDGAVKGYVESAIEFEAGI
jgi:hypothetical protein